MQKRAYSIGIVGATGLVGQALRALLSQRSFPLKTLRLFASGRSAGQQLDGILVEQVQDNSFEELDGIFLCAGSEVAQDIAPKALAHGCWVVDNSSAFRMRSDVPLVVPEVNAEALQGGARLIANPNCSTIIALMALAPLHKAFDLCEFVASTYQAVSGSGLAAVDALSEELKIIHDGGEVNALHYRHPIAMNVIPEVDVFLEDGSTREEQKMLEEGRKILNLPELRVATTCVRVPVARAHSIALTAGFKRPVSVADAEAVLDGFPGLVLCKKQEDYPTPMQASLQAECYVGRLRKANVFEHGLSLWVVGDQLWKGAALNAIQIAEQLIKRNDFQ